MPAQAFLVPDRLSTRTSRMWLTLLVWAWCAYCSNLGCYVAHGRNVCNTKPFPAFLADLDSSPQRLSSVSKEHHRRHPEDYTRHQNQNTRTSRASDPWQPPASAVAFGEKKGSGVDVREVGNTMGKKGWHFAALQKLAAVHTSVTLIAFPPTRDELSFFVSLHHHSTDPDDASCGHVNCRPQGRSGRDTMVALCGLG